MDKKAFILSVSRFEIIKSVMGIEYRITSADDSYIIGKRMSTGTSFKIPSDKLFVAYQDLIKQKLPLTTSALKPYVYMAQSPLLAILKKLSSVKK